MTPDETLAVLLVLAGRVPAEHVTPDRAMAVAWHPDLKPFDSGVALNVAYAWPNEAFPSAGVFLNAVQTEARRQATSRLSRPATPPRVKPTPAQVEKVRALVALTKRALYDHGARAQLAAANADPMDEDF